VSKKQRRSLALIPVMLLFAGLYINRMSSILIYDEAYTLRHYAIDPAYALLSYTLPNNHLLQSLLVWFSRITIGPSPVGLRFPAFALGLLSLAMIYRLGSRVWSRQAGLIAMLLMGASHGFVLYTSLARGYTLSIFLTCVLVYLVLFKPIQKYLILACCAALVMTLPSMVLLIGAVGIWALWQRRSLAMPLIVGTIAGTMFYVPSLLRADPGYYTSFGPSLSMLGQSISAVLFGSLIYVVIIFVIAGVGFWQLRDRSRWLFLIIVGVVPITSVIQQIVTGSVFPARTFLYLLPVIYMPVGIGLITLAKQYAVLASVAGVVVSLLIWSPPADTQESQAVVGVMAAIDEHVSPGESVVIGCCIQEPIWYYMAYRAEIFSPYDKDSVYIVETEFESEGELRELYGLTDFVCEPYDAWSGYDVYVCRAPAG